MVAGLGSLGACTVAAPVAQAPTATSASSEPPPRRPDGVMLEPAPALPPVSARAEARGVIALREPLSGDDVREVARALLEAWQHESLDGLSALLSTDAGPIEARGRGRAALLESWRQRLHAHEYHKLAGVELARPDRVEHFAWDELGGPGAPARPPEMHADETYARVPLEVTQLAGEKFFEGSTIVLLLRKQDGKVRVAAYGEE